MMVSRPTVQIIIAIAVGLWALLLTLQGVAVELAWLRWYSLVVGVVVVCLMAFDRWLWRIRPFAYAVKVPNISGTWKGELRSSWVNSETGAGIAPIAAFLVVRQTYSSVSVALMTEESKSYSSTAKVEPVHEGEAVLTYTYMNTPRLRLQERSRIHHGSTFLDVHGSPPEAIVGSYWTDRDTKGEMEFRTRAPKAYTEFEAAVTAFQ